MKKATIKHTVITVVLAVLLVPLLTGCETLAQKRARTEMREREDQLYMQESLQRMTARIESLEYEIGRLQDDLARVRDDALNSTRTELQSMHTEVQGLEREIAQVDAARQRDKKEIVDTLTKKVAEVLKSGGSSRGARTSRGYGEYGYEHVVQPGETLSEISVAYGVKVDVIIDANNIKNPNRLQAGQTLFIPE